MSAGTVAGFVECRRVPPPRTSVSAAPSPYASNRAASMRDAVPCDAAPPAGTTTAAAAPSPNSVALSGWSKLIPIDAISAETMTAAPYRPAAMRAATVSSAARKLRHVAWTLKPATPMPPRPSARSVSGAPSGIACSGVPEAKTSRSMSASAIPASATAARTAVAA